MPTNRSMVPGVFIPELPYPDVNSAAVWLCRSFGFRERLRIGDHRVQLMFRGAGMVVVEGQGPESGQRVMVQVEDARGHHAIAVASGARIVSPPIEYPFGERQYTAEDPAGHRWTFSESIADIDPASWGGVLVEDGA